MPSDCIVPVVEVRNVRAHPNADMLSIVEVLGYQMVTGLVEDPNGPLGRVFVKGARDERGRRVPLEDCDERPVETVYYSFRYKEGDRAVYFPADTVLTDERAKEFEVDHLLKTGNRVGRARLRGEPSFGLIIALPDEGADWELGRNVADRYDCRKWEPPVRDRPKDEAPYDSDIDPHFVEYTDIQNGKLLFEKFNEGELVVATEKIHGRNCRIGIIDGAVTCGSRTSRKVDGSSIFWQPRWLPGVDPLLRAAEEETGAVNIILFGEVYGQGVQSLHYGRKKDEKGFRAFDLYVDGDYLDYPEFKALCDRFGIETAPALYTGEFDLAEIQRVADGRSALPGADNIREGVVVRTMKERRDPALGRVVLKFIGTNYELSKHKKKDTTDL